MDHTRGWLAAFFQCRDGGRPDGRPLYSYRASESEYERLCIALEKDGPGKIYDPEVCQGLAFFISEWWRRHYPGGSWAWQPILELIGWDNVAYYRLYDPLRDGWARWRVTPVVLNGKILFLGTAATQGGLPLAAVGNGSQAFGRYLKSLLQQQALFGASVESVVLAKGLDHLLPKSLRQEPVYMLAAELVCGILPLKMALDGHGGVQDAVALLDQKVPGWHDHLPVDMSQDQMKDMVNVLLLQIAQGEVTLPASIKVLRTLVSTANGWQLRAKAILPRQMGVQHLANMMDVPSFPERVQFRIGERAPQAIANGRCKGDFVHLSPLSIPLDALAEEAAGALPVVVVAGGALGQAIFPDGGDALTDLPWVFLDSGDDGRSFALHGQGTVRTRASRVVLAVPSADAVSAIGDSTIEPVGRLEVHQRDLLRVTGTVTVQVDDGVCKIVTRSEDELVRDHAFLGQRFHQVSCRIPLFLGAPQLQEVQEEGLGILVSSSEVSWRRTSADSWLARPDGPGIWRMRRECEGAVLFTAKVGVLPAEMRVAVEAGTSELVGQIRIENCPGNLVVTTDDPEVEATTTVVGNDMVVSVVADSQPPAQTSLVMRFPSGDAIQMRVPFPGLGGRFTHPRQPVATRGRGPAISQLYGWRAVAVSPDPNDKVWLEGFLIAKDATQAMRRAAHFEVAIPRGSTGTHELALVDVREQLEDLFSATDHLDAEVELNLHCSARVLAETRVRRFSGELQRDDALFFLPAGIVEDEASVEAVALSLRDPGTGWVSLEVATTENVQRGWTLRANIPVDHPLLVLARRAGEAVARPKFHGDATTRDLAECVAEPSVVRSLAEAADIRDEVQRLEAFDTVLADMTRDGSNDENWAYLEHLLAATEGLPPTTFDCLDRLVKAPEVMIRLAFNIGDVELRRRLWGLESQMRFAWILAPLTGWGRQARRVFDRQVEELCRGGLFDRAMAEQIVRDHLVAVMDEAIAVHPALRLARDIVRDAVPGFEPSKFLQLCSHGIPALKVLQKQLEEARQELLRSDPEWPTGPDAGDWKEFGALAAEFPWELLGGSEQGVGFRRPLMHCPVGAAIAAYEGVAVRPVLVRFARQGQRDFPYWFANAYLLTNLLLIADSGNPLNYD